MAKKKGKRPSKTARWLFIADRSYELAFRVLKYALIAWVAWLIYLAIKETANKDTFAYYVIDILSFDTISDNVAFLFAICSFIWALLERVFRHKKTTELTDRVRVFGIESKRGTRSLRSPKVVETLISFPEE